MVQYERQQAHRWISAACIALPLNRREQASDCHRDSWGDDMPLRFYRRFRAGPLRVNLSKHRISWSLGGRGAWVTFGNGRVRTSLGVPGTGLGWYEQRQLTTPAIAMPTLRATLRRAVWAIAMLVIAGVALMLAAAVLPR